MGKRTWDMASVARKWRTWTDMEAFRVPFAVTSAMEKGVERTDTTIVVPADWMTPFPQYCNK